MDPLLYALVGILRPADLAGTARHVPLPHLEAVLFNEADLGKRFLYYFLPQHTHEIESAGRGISMVHITKDKMASPSVPIRPFAEQHRIVALVDKPMAPADDLAATVGAAGGTRRLRLDSLRHESPVCQEAASNGGIRAVAGIGA